MNIINIVLWVLQVLSAVTFGQIGVTHLRVSSGLLDTPFVWMFDISPTMNAIIGIAEILAALGLILPGVVRIQTRLTLLAAFGLVLTMIGGFIFNISNDYVDNISANIIWVLVNGFIAFGRWKLRPLKDRSSDSSARGQQ